MLLNEDVAVIPDVAPLLALGAVTGMRCGEFIGVKQANIVWRESRLKVDTAIDAGRRVKTTKTRKERSFYVEASLDALRLYCDEMNERARMVGPMPCAPPRALPRAHRRAPSERHAGGAKTMFSRLLKLSKDVCAMTSEVRAMTRRCP